MVTTFREAIVSDACNVAEVYLNSRREFLSYAPLIHSDADIHDWIANVLIPGGRVLVAESSSGVVGMMALSEESGFGWIDHLYLDPSAVGHGIGSLFVDHAKVELGGLIRLYAFQANLRCCRFYERHGFQPIAFSDGAANEEKCPDVLYQFKRAPEEPTKENKAVD